MKAASAASVLEEFVPASENSEMEMERKDMILCRNPHIDVDELRNKVVAAVASARVRSAPVISGAASGRKPLPIFRASAPQPQPQSSGQTIHVAQLLAYYDEEFIRATYSALLGRKPDNAGMAGFLDGLRSGRIQRIEVVEEIMASAEARAAGTRVLGLRRVWLRRLLRMRGIGYLVRIASAVLRLPRILRAVELAEARADHRFRAQELRLETEWTHLTVAIQGTLEQLAGDIATARTEMDDIRSMGATDRDRLEQTLSKIGSSLERLDGERAALASRLQGLSTALSMTSAAVGRNDAIVDGLQSHYDKTISHLEAGVRDVADRVGRLWDNSNLDLFTSEFAGLYQRFENAYRGDRADIMLRHEAYLPQAGRVRAETGNLKIADLGCGRGELLELLRRHDFVAEGVDSNPEAVSHCRKLGLKAVHQDVLAYMEQQDDQSLAMIAATHLVEHLPIPHLIRLIRLCRSKLHPAGVVIFETPNPRNLLVGACSFWLDPTHRQPLPPETLDFLMREGGFENVQIMSLDRGQSPDLSELPKPARDLLDRAFAASADYAALGFIQ